MVKKKKKFKFWILDSRCSQKTKEETKDEYRVSSIETPFTKYDSPALLCVVRIAYIEKKKGA